MTGFADPEAIIEYYQCQHCKRSLPTSHDSYYEMDSGQVCRRCFYRDEAFDRYQLSEEE